MITIFEGPRNSGKTYLSHEYSRLNNTEIFKFDFVGWFDRLSLADDKKETHLFALGKELMLLQLNSQGLLPDFVLDRGILTVLTWGVISNRISKETALSQLEMISSLGLFENCEIVFVTGQNPSTELRNKDHWDNRESSQEEIEMLKILVEIVSDPKFNINVKCIENTFDDEVIQKLENI